MDPEDSRARFHTTRLSLIGRLSDEKRRGEALEELGAIYLPPVFAYLVRSGVAREEAGEIAQEFFCDVVIQRSLFDSFDPLKGRLRTFLVVALKRHLVSRNRRPKGPGGARPVPLDVMREEAILGDLGGDSPEAAFDRSFALQMFGKALARCERHYRESGRVSHWEVFHAHVVLPIVGSTAATPLAELAVRHGFRYAGDVGSAIQVVKHRFLTILREVVEDSVCDPSHADAEFRHVIALIRGG